MDDLVFAIIMVCVIVGGVSLGQLLPVLAIYAYAWWNDEL